ncbi:MAG TPA: ATPase domain-containing protein [Candidatus Micrarchaeota archaeon]|nr:ATPase domain-containing protein [Candidatus Micrarchaeota archaeon]
MPENQKLIQTGIAGLDQMCGGGIEQGSTVIVAAGAGSGKSTLAMQYIYNGITKFGENGLYITFEEQKDKVYAHMKKFGFDLAEVEKSGKLKFLEYPPTEVDKFINSGSVIADIIEENKIKRIVIDSVTSLVLLSESEYKRRESFLKTMSLLKRWGCTTLLTSEARQTASGDVRSRFGLEYLADGFIVVHSIRKKDVREFAIEVVKMRGLEHSKKMAPMKITSTGLIAYPNQTVFGDAGF